MLKHYPSFNKKNLLICHCIIETLTSITVGAPCSCVDTWTSILIWTCTVFGDDIWYFFVSVEDEWGCFCIRIWQGLQSTPSQQCWTGCHLFLGHVEKGVWGRPIPCSGAVDCKDVSVLCLELEESVQEKRPEIYWSKWPQQWPALPELHLCGV